MTHEPILRVAFVDRDGTINVDRGLVHRIEDWEFTLSACQALVLLRDLGFRIAVVTNQSGIAAGKYSVGDVERLHAFMRKELARSAVQLDALVYCPHAPDGSCDCRKPRIGMARLLERELGRTIDYAGSWMIGDKLSDVAFGKSLGTKTALIRSRYWSEVGSAAEMLGAEKGEAESRVVPADRPLTPTLSPELLAMNRSMNGGALVQAIRGRGGRRGGDAMRIREGQVAVADMIVDSLFEAAQRIAAECKHGLAARAASSAKPRYPC